MGRRTPPSGGGMTIPDSKYLLCGQPTFLWSVTEMREWESELLALDQRDQGVIDCLKEVQELIAEKGPKS